MSAEIRMNGTAVEVPQEVVPAMLARFSEDAQNFPEWAEEAHGDDRDALERNGATAAKIAKGLTGRTDVQLDVAEMPYVLAVLAEDSGSVLAALWAAKEWGALAE